MAEQNIIEQVVTASSNRRSMLKKLGMASAALTAGSAVGVQNLGADPSTPTPVDVVQFALNLEYLEAEFYSVATTGQTIEQRGVDISGIGTPGPTTTSYGKVNFGNNLVFTGSVANLIAADEISHVIDLRAALLANGQTPIAKPAINLDALAPAGASLANQQTFLVLSRAFEDIGMSAYAGAAPLLASAPTILAAAARILAVEALHVANVRLQIARLNIPTAALDAADVPPPPTGTNFFTTNVANGLIPTRTPGQVLYLAYGNQANVIKGGFFPTGVNGNLVTSSAPATAANLA